MLFVCKDSEWAITTLSETVTAGKLTERARGFGMAAVEVDGNTIEDVWEAARPAINRARKGEGPTFIHAHCAHPEGHFLGDPLLRVARHPVQEMKQMAGPLLKSAIKKKGASLRERANSLGSITSLIGKAAKGYYRKQDDPVKQTRDKLKSEKGRLQQQEEEVVREIQAVVEVALQDR